MSSQDVARLASLLNTPNLTSLDIFVTISGEIQLTAVGPNPTDIARVTFEGLTRANLFEFAPQAWWQNSPSLQKAAQIGWITIPADQAPPGPEPEPIPTPSFVTDTTGGMYIAVPTIAERNALAGMPRGFRVRVLSTPYVYEWTGEFWATVEVVGNRALVDLLTGKASVYTMYVSADGSDDNPGTLEAPFRTIQRAFDEVPDHVNGTAIVQLLGAGPFDEAIARDYQSPSFLHLMVVGDRSTPGPSGAISGPGSIPSNPNGGVKHCAVDYNIGSYANAPFSNGSHWIEVIPQDPTELSSFGFPAVFAVLMDGTNSTTPNIRAAISGDFGELFGEFGNITLTTHPFVSVIENQRLDSDFGAFTHFTWLRAPDSFSQKVYYVGCVLGPVATGVTITNCATRACRAHLFYVDDSNDCDINIHMMWSGQPGDGEVVVATRDRDQYVVTSDGGGLSGIFDGGVIDFFDASGFVGSCIFRNLGSAGFQIVIGTHTNPAPGSALKIDSCDFEPPSGQNGILARRTHIRHGSFGGSSLNANVSTFMQIDQGSWGEVEQPVHGSTSGVSVIVGSFTQCTGLASFNGQGTQMHNRTSAGQDVQVGALASPVAWSALPKTDISRGDNALFSRAE